ncbi:MULTISPECIES: OsmC family protein [Brachymonas]|uniref:OsmC family protein n=1 Tax=Brachymonas TaxID=28219 RepID=UPI002E76C8A8|nr:OsmC family protein [Brachymonas sp. J145]MEE1652281.1 OsmC family protein [Brachymonas sp. J145]
MSATPFVRATLGDTPYLVTLQDDLGHTWTADEPEELGGGNTASSPDRLILASLGACTAITIQMVATRRQIPLTGVQVELSLNPDGKPEAGTDIARRVLLQGELDEDQRAQLLKIANICPMHKLLTGEVRISTELAD